MDSAPISPVLYGIAPGLARGQLHPRAVPVYNALHRFWGPLAFGILALAAGLADGYLVGALPWALHVAFDRTIGLRLRSPDGFQRPEGSGPSRPWSLLSSSAYASRQRGGACLS